MISASTVTQKGQIVIPVAIRKALNIQPNSRVIISMRDDEMVVKRAMTVEEACGFIKTDKKPLSREEEKRIVREAVAEKYVRENT